VTPLGIHHVSVGVQVLDAALAFYGTLGLTVDPDRPGALGVGGAWLFAGEQQVHLIVTDAPAPGGTNHLALVVADLDECLAELERAGISARRLAYVEGAGRQAFVRDPSGNAIELNERVTRS